MLHERWRNVVDVGGTTVVTCRCRITLSWGQLVQHTLLSRRVDSDSVDRASTVVECEWHAEEIAHALVEGGGYYFGEEVSKVGRGWCPEDVEFLLLDAIA